jgi:Fic family protein
MAYDRNKPYNNLPLLPTKEPIHQDIEVLNKLVITSRALATVNINLMRLPNPLMLVNTIALQEAKESAAIENIFTTDDELYKAASETIQEAKANTSTKEVLRYREALWAGYAHLKEKGKIDQDAIIDIFRAVKDNPSLGIRTEASQTVIKRGQSEFRAGEVVYTPPRGNVVLDKLLNNLLEYIDDDVQYPIDPLLKMCIAHYQFEAIHPFHDGNGRTGRILNLLFLIQKGLLLQPALYLSKYIVSYKDDYYYHLGAVTQRGQWKNWVMYMLEATEKSAQLTNELINNIIKQMEATLAYAKDKIKWYTKEVNELVFSQPYIKPKLIADFLDIKSRTTITAYFKELVAAQILSEKKVGREVFYINHELVDILA